ncbi:hypothetical protein JXJ21_18745 [candidate division KSB1 bacterium]|nr:hypothetical protein [candidate division KSB1 bacterium]
MIKKQVLIFYFGCIVLLCTTTTSCYINKKVHSINTENIRESKPFVTNSPTKAHLNDGSLIVFERGLVIKNNTLKGVGIKYDLSRQNRYPFYGVTMDSVVCLKYYKKDLQVFSSVMLNPFVQFVSVFNIVGQLTYHEEEEDE